MSPLRRRIPAAVALLTVAGCSALPADGDTLPSYKIVTDAGPVLVELDGFAHGYSHAALNALVREGVARAGRGPVVSLEPGESLPAKRIVLHVEEGFRPAVAQVTLTLSDMGRPVRSSSARAPAPGAFPSAVFIQTVSALTGRLLQAVRLHLPAKDPERV